MTNKYLNTINIFNFFDPRKFRVIILPSVCVYIYIYIYKRSRVESHKKDMMFGFNDFII